MLARARVVNSSNLSVFAEVHVEDSEGRHIAQGSLHSAVFRIDPPPPPPPESMPPVQEPVYDSPDPYLRHFPVSPVAELLESESGLNMLRQFQDGRLSMPVASLYGVILEDFEEGRMRLSIPASEWFCAFTPHICCSTMGALADMAVFCGVVGLHRPGSPLALVGSSTSFLQRARPDGRRLRAETTVRSPTPRLHSLEVTIHDSDDKLLAQASALVGLFDSSRRQRRQATASRRVLATLLFVDIVDSTGHALRLGDAGWRTLLEKYRLKLRREISRFNGTEVDTAGDGFFVRFDSPAYAIEAARAARVATAALDIELRAGVHAGECEMEGNRLAGMAVHVAARIIAEAGPGEILVSSTVKELAGGSGIHFNDRGEKPLKGVPETLRLYEVAD